MGRPRTGGRPAGGAREAVEGSSRLTACLRPAAAPCLEYCSSESDLGHTSTTITSPPPPPPRQRSESDHPATTWTSVCIAAPAAHYRRHSCVCLPAHPPPNRLSRQPSKPTTTAAGSTIPCYNTPRPRGKIDWRPTCLLSSSPPYYCTFTSKQWPRRHSETA